MFTTPLNHHGVLRHIKKPLPTWQQRGIMQIMTPQISTDRLPELAELGELYASVGWTNYTADLASLHRGVCASTRVVTAWVGEQLVGLARILSDGETIAYLQDILVHPDHQRTGIGRELFTQVFAPYAQLRQQVLMTDDEPRQQAFYTQMGFTEVRDLNWPTRVYLRNGS